MLNIPIQNKPETIYLAAVVHWSILFIILQEMHTQLKNELEHYQGNNTVKVIILWCMCVFPGLVTGHLIKKNNELDTLRLSLEELKCEKYFDPIGTILVVITKLFLLF